MKRILAIDYGEVRVGFAVSDELGITAQGLDTLVINKNDKAFFKGVFNLVSEYDVDTIVIGYPKNMNGSSSSKTDKIDNLAQIISDRFNVKVVKWDERLTTVSAYNTMKTLNISQKQKNKFADKFSAIYLLEGYLARLNNQKKGS